MSTGKISAKQQEILEYIKESILNKGYPPAVREICEAVHLSSTSSVHSHLETLEKNGYIRRDFKVLIDFNIIFSVITKIIVIFAFNLNSLTINRKLYNE